MSAIAALFRSLYVTFWHVILGEGEQTFSEWIAEEAQTPIRDSIGTKGHHHSIYCHHHIAFFYPTECESTPS